MEQRPSTAGQGLEWLRRPVFGLLLALAALAALVAGGRWFAAFIAVGTIAGAREWHRLVSHKDYLPFIAAPALAVVISLGVASFAPAVQPWLGVTYGGAVLVIVLAAVVEALFARGRGESVIWQAAGPLYVGLPGLALFGLREIQGHGIWLVLLIFAAIWGCDTGAYVSGKLIGGPKLAPRLSPNKTWAGFIGGVATGAAAATVVMALLGTPLWRGALLGVLIGVIGHGGDMFESWVKRRVGRKDSGRLIPGHGGVLDRIDSILFAAPAVALLVLVLGPHALFGGTS